MHFDGTGYLQTPSFAIPNTGILTVETWMNNKTHISTEQTIMGDAAQNTAIGYIFLYRFYNSGNFTYRYADGTTAALATFVNFFTGYDNQ